MFPDVRPEKARPSPLERLASIPFRSTGGIRLHGVDNLLISFARCCQPVPGDRVIGVITRGRGVSVHRVDCPNVFADRVEKERQVKVEWDVEGKNSFLVKLVVLGADRQGFLADIAQAISHAKTNIKSADMESELDHARGTFLVEVKNLRHLQDVIRAVRRIRGVTKVERQQLFDLGEDTAHA
jgi:GTP pyrophosphokinase